jgi:hypothetical protein
MGLIGAPTEWLPEAVCGLAKHKTNQQLTVIDYRSQRAWRNSSTSYTFHDVLF